MTASITSEVQMANLALAHLDEPSINAFDSTNVASRWFKQFYAAKRDAFLAGHYWNFAMKLAALAADSEGPAFRFTYQYTVPSDCLRLLPITDDGSRTGNEVVFEVIGNKIMTNKAAPLYIQYVKRVEEEAYFDPLFIDAFSYYLAAGCCHAITGKNSLLQTLEQKLASSVGAAARADAMQGTPYPRTKSKYVTCRSESW